MSLAGMLVDLGRICLGGLFVVGGVRHFLDLTPVTAAMAARGVPMPRAALVAGSVFEIVAGALLVAGLFTAAAAAGLIVFTIAASLMLLCFWRMPAGPERAGVTNNLISNIGVVGGLLVIAGIGS